jgi:hypothetical protein
MGKKAVVLEVDGRHATVLTEDGDFAVIRVTHPIEPGQEIYGNDIGNSRIKAGLARFPKLYAAAGIALLATLMVFAPTLLPNSEVVAYVSLDSAPGVEFAVDKEGRVTNIIGEDGEIGTVIYGTDLKNRKIADVAAELASVAVRESGKSGADLLITVSSADVKAASAKVTDKIQQDVKSGTEKKLAEDNVKTDIATVKVDSQTRQDAKDMGLSTGKYVILMTAQEEGLDINPEDMKNGNPVEVISNAGGDPQKIIEKATQENELKNEAAN